MDPEERAQALHREADELLAYLRLSERCADIGEITPTGSYFLDAMMYPDIDLYLPPTSAEKLLALGAELARHECVTKLRFAKGGPGDLKDGLYLKPIIEKGSWERPWKIDMWSLPRDVVERKQADLADLKAKMTPAQRQRILRYKYHILNADGRTPVFSGIHIYRAVIARGMEDFGEIAEFLRQNGVAV